MQRRRESIYFFVVRASAFFGVLVLVAVLAALVYTGGKVISWQFLTSEWQHRNIAAGGIFPAIVGTIIIGVGVAAVSFPVGMATAIYLTEYGRYGKMRRAIEIAIRNLAGVPSVVYGLFGLAVFVHTMQFGTSLLSAILTLSAMTFPWIITASVEAIRAIPVAQRESSLALGATRWQTISRVILPAALPGALTGGILGISRAIGETAPIIIVGATFYITHLPQSLFDKFMALPYHAFILATQHSNPDAVMYASGTALVLVVIIFLLSLSAILTRAYYRNR